MSTKDRILDSALRLLQTRSYEGFSFQDIADEVGIRKASIYSHYRSKEDLAVAVLERARDYFSGGMADGDGEPAAAQLDRYLGLFRRVCPGAERICPGGAFGGVWSSVSPGLQAAVRAFTEYHLGLLECIVGRGRAEGAFADSGRSIAVEAALVFSQVQGALIVARVSGDAGVFDAALEQIPAALKA